MKLIHTADLHLDRCYASLGVPPLIGNRLRQSARDVLHRIVTRAGDWPADALLIAGDLFELPGLARDTVTFLQSEFQSIAHVPIFIVPGKHDPCSQSSPYITEDWPRNVTIFRNKEWRREQVGKSRLHIHGLGYDGSKPPVAPFETMKLDMPETDGIHVALSYGWSKAPAAKAPKETAKAVTYLALGGVHETRQVKGNHLAAAHYPGLPQGQDFSTPGPFNFLEVELLGGKANVRPAPSSRVAFLSHEIQCAKLRTADDLVEIVRKKIAPEVMPLVLRLVLVGKAAPRLRANLGVLHDALSADVQFLDIVDHTKSSQDYAKLAKDDSSFGAFVHAINEEIADCTDNARVELLLRARETGIAAFTSEPCEVKGLEAL